VGGLAILIGIRTLFVQNRRVKRFKKFIFGSTLLLMSLAISLLAAEFAVRYLYYSPQQRALPAQDLYRSQEAVDFSNFEQAHPGCSWDDSVIAHPYLGFVHHSLPPCGLQEVNEQGFEGKRDLPRYKDPRYFTILVVGTSVAEQLATYVTSDGQIIFEQVLNQNFVSPNGKPFHVLNGAVGGTARPDANIVSLLYGDAVDGIISIDGFNEINSSRGGSALFGPAATYDGLIKTPYSRDYLVRSALAFEIRSFFKKTRVLNSSFLAFLIQKKAVDSLLAGMHSHSIADLKSKLYFKQFMTPPGESLEEGVLWNVEKYKLFIRANDATAKVMNVRYAHFLQPTPAFKLYLTPEEKAVPLMVTRERYQKFIGAMNDLKKEHFPVFSLVDIYRDIKRRIYIDSVHCIWENGDSPGYRIMANEIGKRLAGVWGIKERGK
jgi:hypothetical protein